MRFQLAVEPPHLVLQLAAGCVERVPDRNVGIFVPPAPRGIARDFDALAAGHRYMDTDAIGIALVVAMLGAGNHHTGRRDRGLKRSSLCASLRTAASSASEWPICSKTIRRGTCMA